MSDIQIFCEAFDRILAQHYAPDKLRAMEYDTAVADDAMAAISDAGFLDVMRCEEDGGAGLSFTDATEMFRLIGYYAAPSDIALRMISRATNAVDEQPSQEVMAIIHALLISGAIDKIQEICIAHVTTRHQFGKPIGKQQAIQHQLAMMAEQSAVVRVSAQYAAAMGNQSSKERAAIAKYTASKAVVDVVSYAHAVHGAIGITQEYDLQLWVRRLHDWRMNAGSESYWANIMGKSRLNKAGENSAAFANGI